MYKLFFFLLSVSMANLSFAQTGYKYYNVFLAHETLLSQEKMSWIAYPNQFPEEFSFFNFWSYAYRPGISINVKSPGVVNVPDYVQVGDLSAGISIPGHDYTDPLPRSEVDFFFNKKEGVVLKGTLGFYEAYYKAIRNKDDKEVCLRRIVQRVMMDTINLKINLKFHGAYPPINNDTSIDEELVSNSFCNN